MDYDQTQISTSYDAARAYDEPTLAMWLSRISATIPPQCVSEILDLGCGTGRYSIALANYFNASVTGIDPSQKMLCQAREKQDHSMVHFQCAPAEKIPAQDSSIDMVFMSNIYHHLADHDAVADECHRVLKPLGYIVLRNSTSDQVASFPYIKFFPGIDGIIRQYQPSTEEVTNLFINHGFIQVSHEVVCQNMAKNWYALFGKSKRRADSLLARLPEADYRSGMQALETYSTEKHRDQTVTVNIDLFVFQSKP